MRPGVVGKIWPTDPPDVLWPSRFSLDETGPYRPRCRGTVERLYRL